ncbi:hypothetical protein DFH09DRAFT_1454887 [Mycena vulgaris]|nr:hypothetical protein DFH09DRAFT_1454887 [Mycena vulgaris]
MAHSSLFFLTVCRGVKVRLFAEVAQIHLHSCQQRSHRVGDGFEERGLEAGRDHREGSQSSAQGGADVGESSLDKTGLEGHFSGDEAMRVPSFKPAAHFDQVLSWVYKPTTKDSGNYLLPIMAVPLRTVPPVIHLPSSMHRKTPTKDPRLAEAQFHCSSLFQSPNAMIRDHSPLLEAGSPPRTTEDLLQFLRVLAYSRAPLLPAPARTRVRLKTAHPISWLAADGDGWEEPGDENVHRRSAEASAASPREAADGREGQGNDRKRPGDQVGGLFGSHLGKGSKDL